MAKPMRYTQEMIDAYIADRRWDPVSIPDILGRHAKNNPQREALVDSRRRLSWSQLDQITDRAAVTFLQLGLIKDQVVLAQLPTSSALVILLLACQKAGLICCFAPMTFRRKEMAHVLKTLRAAAVVSATHWRDTDFYDMVQQASADLNHLKFHFVAGDPVPEGALSFDEWTRIPQESGPMGEGPRGQAFDPFEVSMVVLSSGTTGMPKCIEHTGVSSKAGGWGIVKRAKLGPEDVIGCIAPLSGGPGLQNWWAGFQVGARFVLLERFTPQGTLELIERERVTYLPAIPTQLARVLKETDPGQYDLSSLQIVRTGAAAFDPVLAEDTEKKLGCKVLIAGGAQETYSFAQSGVDDPREKRLNTLGKPFPGNEVKICTDRGDQVPQGEVGHLYVRGASTSSGYFGDMVSTLAAWGKAGPEGWYKTGDLAKLDEDGYLVLAGRVKEIIIRGGQNIYPKEIEDILNGHSKIRQAILIGIPDPVMGEKAFACVNLVDEEELTFEEMTAFLKEKGLAVHKLPERLEILSHFPNLADGQKVDKIALRRMIEEKIVKNEFQRRRHVTEGKD